VIALSALWYWGRGDRIEHSYDTVPVKRGDLIATISATGTVEPEEVVDVGAQVAGKVVSFGQDNNGNTIDYGSVVEVGTVLARIDDALYAADVDQARAQLEQATAGLRRAEADLVQLQARLMQADRDWTRARKLGPSEALSQSDYDAALSGYEVAKANVTVGKAAIAQAQGAISQAEASLRRSQQNFEYCTIRSPVKGVIIDRRVNTGQTVVASLSAPSLFLIAKDLTRLQIWVAVNEADVGHIRPSQAASFTIDAFPGRVFRGQVEKMRLNASMSQNVVTYTVEVTTDNSDGLLLPYLTANVKFLVDERHEVLLVPNAALRFTPAVMSDPPNPGSEEDRSSPLDSARDARKEGQARGTVWVPEGRALRRIAVRIGLTDGSLTEVEGLEEGTPLVVGELQDEANGLSYSSPFAPQFSKDSRTRPNR
jgi:HlyD family secretion protein